jgi:hypothetical protein
MNTSLKIGFMVKRSEMAPFGGSTLLASLQESASGEYHHRRRSSRPELWWQRHSPRLDHRE